MRRKMTGKVIRSYGKTHIVLSEGQEHRCELLAKAKVERGQSPIAVGDIVDFLPSADGVGGIEFVHPRRTRFSRPKVGRDATFEQIIVSNVDQMVIVASVAAPPLKLHLVDRFTVAALKGGLQPIVVINKIDLPHKVDLQRVKEIYSAVNFPTLLVSALDGTGLDQLRESLSGKESILVGHSGVGKSSLLNSISPGLRLRTAEVSGFTGKGRHTTTTVELFPIGDDSFVVDTPGLKVLGIWDIEKDEVQNYFPEFDRYLGKCKFARCSHIHEPECAVRQALDKDQIFTERFQSYARIYEAAS